MQNLNNYIQSEQLKRNGRKPESSKSIRSLYKGRYLLMHPALNYLQSFYQIAVMRDYNFELLQIKQSDLLTTPLKNSIAKEKTNE